MSSYLRIRESGVDIPTPIRCPNVCRCGGTVMRRPAYDTRLLETADAIDRGFFHIHFELRAVESQGVIEYRWVLVTPIDMHC